MPLAANDHLALRHDCYLDCSRVTTFREQELLSALNRGPISAAVAGRIVDLLRDHPPKTLVASQRTLVINNLYGLP